MSQENFEILNEKQLIDRRNCTKIVKKVMPHAFLDIPEGIIWHKQKQTMTEYVTSLHVQTSTAQIKVDTNSSQKQKIHT